MVENADKLDMELWNNIDYSEYENTKYIDHVLEQYKIYVESAERVSSRRNLANTFFLTLNTAIVASSAAVYTKGITITGKWWIIFPLIAIELLCFSWMRLIKSYRQLNSGKFKVIGEMEKKLPASPYWNAEWKVLGEGKDSTKYKPLTVVETWIPILFGLLYLIGAVAVIL